MTDLVRREDWPALLDAFLLASRNREFSYGQMDCCLFVCDCIATMTGTDPGSPFRGRYDSRRGSIRAMQEYCGSPSVEAVTALVTAQHGMPEIPPLSAGRGDLVLIEQPDGFAIGIVSLNGREIVVSAEAGLQAIPLALAVRAWRV